MPLTQLKECNRLRHKRRKHQPHSRGANQRKFELKNLSYRFQDNSNARHLFSLQTVAVDRAICFNSLFNLLRTRLFMSKNTKIPYAVRENRAKQTIPNLEPILGECFMFSFAQPFHVKGTMTARVVVAIVVAVNSLPLTGWRSLAHLKRAPVSSSLRTVLLWDCCSLHVEIPEVWRQPQGSCVLLRATESWRPTG